MKLAKRSSHWFEPPFVEKVAASPWSPKAGWFTWYTTVYIEVTLAGVLLCVQLYLGALCYPLSWLPA